MAELQARTSLSCALSSSFSQARKVHETTTFFLVTAELSPILIFSPFRYVAKAEIT